MKTYPPIFVQLLLVFSFGVTVMYSQQADSVTSAFDDYAMVPREVAYLSLNKSTYIKGESIGFTAYVLDKKTKKTSKDATNLYVSIEDDKNNVIKQKLLKLEHGTSSNIFELDGSFTSGYYTIKAYTNWMRNFNEQDFFVETIRVIDPKVETYIETELVQTKIDAQFLPESGHLVEQISSAVGVVVKDKLGYGVPNATGKVYDNNYNLVSEFKLNALGMGRFLLLPEIDKSYNIEIDYKNKIHSFKLNQAVESLGVILSIKELKDKVFVTLNTNKKTLAQQQNKGYKLTVHNGDKIDARSIYFKDDTKITKTYELTQLPTGMNVFTLFNEANQPVAERLFFNYNGLKDFKTFNVTAQAINDSIQLKVNLKNIDADLFNTLSVSVLPSDTQSFKRHNNIISYNYLQPYIKGHIENAKYYFTKVSDKTKYDMDNLLLTQGWSSYDWYNIFNNTLTFKYPFEEGITIKANVNAKNINPQEAYMVSGPNIEEPNVFTLNEGEKSFMVKNVFPSDKDSIFISKLEKNRKPSSPKLYLQAFPSIFPELTQAMPALKPKHNYQSEANLSSKGVVIESIKEAQQLEEVVVVTERDKARIRAFEISKETMGDVHVITDADRKANFFLEDYLNTLGIYNYNSNGIWLALAGMWTPRFNIGIIIDDLPFGNSFYSRWPLSEIDYVVLNPSGLGWQLGQGMNSTNGAIQIYTRGYTGTMRDNKKSQTTGQSYDIALKFSSSKKYYAPRYQTYNTDFYKAYGTVDWKPELKSNNNGTYSFTIAKPEIPVTLFIEGMVNNNVLLYDEKAIDLN